ncbi:MAG: sulfite exporter TauE/SafE family protein [Pseudomonadota bacterium]
MPDLISLLPFVLVLCAVGAFAGVLAGLLGIGGGIVLVPAFFYVFSEMGFETASLMQVCVATSLATIIVTSARSAQSHRKKGSLDMSILKPFAPGLALGAIVGVFVVQGLESRVLQGLFGVFGAVIAMWLIFGREEWRLAESFPQGIARPVMGFGVGGLSTLLGIGGGNIGVPLMTLYGVPILRAVGTSAGFGLIIALPSVLGFLFVDAGEGAPPLTFGLVNLPAFLVVVAMTLITTPMGVWLAHKLPARPLRIVFAVSICIAALNMGLRAIAG